MSNPASASGLRHSDFDLRTSPLVSVCSEIGRGHPSYLDSVLLALARLCPDKPAAECHTVPELCPGISGLAWSLARSAYHLGGQGGPATWLYNRLRSPDAKPSGLQLSLLGTNLRRTFAGYEGICIVDHPLLAHILAPVCRVAYLHCEIAAPGLAAVPRAWRTFVPLQATSLKLQAAGVRPDALAVTGLLVEPELTDVAESAFQARITRLASDRPLTIGFFSSGAEPRPHSLSIITGASSVTRAGHKAVISWGTGSIKAMKVQIALRREGMAQESYRILWARDRQAVTTAVAGIFPELDLMVCAAHERTNWAVGLGLPMFALLPNIGPFASGNYAFALEQGTCLPLEGVAGAAGLVDTIAALRRSGRLAEMARNGWDRHTISGAETAARVLLRNPD
jgi:hypothetical protein